MNFKNYPFGELPFSSLFQSYTTDYEKVSAFYETNPFHLPSIKSRAENFNFKGTRNEIVEFLLNYNRRFSADKKAINNIKRLKSDDALALVTGQQLGLFGGPVYTFYKIVTVIHRARELEKQLGRGVIPVFWLADEDHDYEEVRTVNILNKDKVQPFSLPGNQSNRPVSEIPFPQQLNELKTEVKANLIDTDFSDELGELIDTCFTTEKTFLEGFGALISQLFSKHGLALAGSSNAEVKRITKQVFIDSVKKNDEIYSSLSKQTETLQDAFHQQVTLYNSHLFYLSDGNGRLKINRNENGWFTDSGRRWNESELVDELESQPEKFSPDVFLRPIVQDQLLPVLGYVGGPGEVAYYGQMKSFYSIFNMKMPVIFPRLSGTFIEPAIVRIFRELPFEINNYQKRIEDLESAYAKRYEEIDIEEVFEEWKEGIEDIQAYHTKVVSKIDETLEGTSRKAQAHYFNELDKLKGKTYRAVKKNEETQIKRIRRIQIHLFPGRSLQERTINGIYYMNKFGIDIWDRLLERLEGNEQFRKHKLIYL